MPLWIEFTNNTFKNKDGVHLFILNFEFHKRYNKLLLCNSENGDIAWCIVSKAESGFCVFLLTKTCFFSTHSNIRVKKTKNTGGLVFSWKQRVFSTLIIFQFFCDFPLTARFGTSHVTINLIGCVPHTYSIGPWYWRSWELLAFEYVKISVDIKTSFDKLNPCSMR